MFYRFFLLLCCFFAAFRSIAQVLPTPPALDFQRDDAALLDSIALLLYGQEHTSHALSMRLGYTNKVLYAGRNYGVNQALMMPSLTYSHKSGWYGDLAGFSYSQSQPRYELTMISAGYIGAIGKKFLYIGEYSRSFFTKPDSNTALSNALTFYGAYSIGEYTSTLTYSTLFGNGSTSSLLVPSFSRAFTFSKLGFIDKITITPSVSASIGSINSFSNTFNPLLNGNPFTNGSMIDTAALRNSGWSGGRPPWATGNTSGTGTYGRPSGASGPPAWVTNAQNPNLAVNKFGVMAYTLSLPISIKIKNCNTSFTPSFIKPVRLSSFESLNPRPQFNFTVGVTYGLKW